MVCFREGCRTTVEIDLMCSLIGGNVISNSRMVVELYMAKKTATRKVKVGTIWEFLSGVILRGAVLFNSKEKKGAIGNLKLQRRGLDAVFLV